MIGAVGSFIRAIPEAVRTVKDWFQTNKQTFIDFGSDVQGVFNGIYNVIKAIIGFIVAVLTPFAKFFVDVFNRIKEPVLSAFQGIWDAITQIFRSVWKIVQGIWDVFVGIFTW